MYWTHSKPPSRHKDQLKTERKSQMEKTMGLTLKNGRHIALKALSWEGTAQGLILTMKNRQSGAPRR